MTRDLRFHIPAPATDISTEGQITALRHDLLTVYNGYGPVTFDGRTLAMRPRGPIGGETHAALVVADRQLPATDYRVTTKRHQADLRDFDRFAIVSVSTATALTR